MVNTFYGANANPYISYGDMGVGITITASGELAITFGRIYHPWQIWEGCCGICTY